ncbi:MAG TPA: hypothetical protein VJA26_18135 [Gammaproteobacteria bacterium]|nr:hypothetical protein [Gammaproteobacteria bacterium]
MDIGLSLKRNAPKLDQLLEGLPLVIVVDTVGFEPGVLAAP